MPVLSFHLKSRDAWSTSTRQADVLLWRAFRCRVPEFHGSNYRRGSRTKLASKAVSARKARAPAGTPNSLRLAKAPNAEDAIAASRTILSTANSKRAVVATEPTKVPSIDMPAAPATVVGTQPSAADPDAASGPASLTKPMPVDATSDGSASPADVTATSSRSPTPSTVEPATPITGSVYKPVRSASSSAPAIKYYGKAKESQAVTSAEDIAASRTPLSTANSKPVVVATEPTKAPSVDVPATPAPGAGTRPSPTEPRMRRPLQLRSQNRCRSMQRPMGALCRSMSWRLLRVHHQPSSRLLK